MTDAALPPGSTIGIFGGGQLGRMLASATAQLGFRCRIFCEKRDAPAFDVASSHVCAPYDDAEAVDEFARGCDVVTFEFENVPAVALMRASALAPVYPPPRALEATQDRLAEKRFLDGLSIPVAPYRAVDSLPDLEAALDAIGRPAMLKTRHFGYDGKGQVRIGGGDPATAYDALARAPAILEGFIDFTREVSIVAARARSGEMAFYDISENRHENQILAETRVPAPADDSVSAAARETAERIAGALDYTGILAIEFFDCGDSRDSTLLVNEIAPRVHNSGHWTLDACHVSQFENHIRAIAGWPLGPTVRHSDATMTNLIGDDMERWAELAAAPGVALHLYGKSESRPGRKMGHYTTVVPRRV